MNDFGDQIRSPSDRQVLRDRLAAAHAEARLAAEHYLRVRREVRATIGESHDLIVRARETRERLRASIMSYVAELRRDQVSPERAIILVKHAVLESASLPDSEHRLVVEESVRWAVDAYYAA